MKKLWKYIKILVTFVILIFFIFYFIENKEDFKFVLSTDWKYLIVIFFFASSNYFLNGVFIKVILNIFNKRINLIEAFYISIISSLGNYFLPMRGGAVIRSVYLKKNFDFSYSYFVSTLYGFYIIVFLVNAFLGLLSLVVIDINNDVPLMLYVFFGLLLMMMILLTFIKIPFEKVKNIKYRIVNKIFNLLKKIFDGWSIIVENKEVLFNLIVITFLSFFASTILFYFEFKALGISVSIFNVILYSCLSGVSLLVSLTPGSLGIREGIYLLTSNVLGIKNEQVMQLALLDRGLIVLTLLILFLFIYTLKYSYERYKKDN